MRITSFDELSNGTVQSIKGNVKIIDPNIGYGNDLIIGTCIIRNYLVAFSTATTDDIGGRGTIWRTDLSVANPVWVKVFEHEDLKFSTRYPIYDEVIGFYEDSDLIKIYWTDNHNMIRSINIMDDRVAGKDPSTLDIVPLVNLNTPTVINISNGNLPVGKIQYAYQYFNINGTETVFSNCTPLIHLVKTSEGYKGTLSRLYEGSPSLDIDGNPNNSGKSVTIEIPNTLIDTNYDKIRIVSILYRNLDQEPDIKVVAEYDVSKDGLIFTDFGTNNIGTLTLNAFRTLGNHELYCKTISQKGNKALIGNITEKFFDVDEALGYSWDARAYRYKPSGGLVSNIPAPITLNVTDTSEIDLTNTTNTDLFFSITPPVEASSKGNYRLGHEGGTVSYLRAEYSEIVTQTTNSFELTKWLTEGNISLQYWAPDMINVTITNVTQWFRTFPDFGSFWTVDNINSFIGTAFITGQYGDIHGNNNLYYDGISNVSNIAFIGDTLFFRLTKVSGYFFHDGFDHFENAMSFVRFRVNYEFTGDHHYVYETSSSSDLIYTAITNTLNSPVWEFKINKITDTWFPCIDPFNPGNITSVSVEIATMYRYLAGLGVAVPTISVYNSRSNKEDAIISNGVAWPNTTYTMYDSSKNAYGSVPDDHDCINPYNYDFLYGKEAGNLNPQIDEYATYWDPTDLYTVNPETNEAYTSNQYKFQSDLITLGGEGPNIKYRFITEDLRIDKSSNSRYDDPGDRVIELLNSYDSYKNPLVCANYMSHKREEVYRYGIVFISHRGQESFAKWIGDIKFPSNNDSGFQMVENDRRISTAKAIGIEFTINATELINAGVKGLKIVRVERKEADRSIYTQGILSRMMLDMTNLSRVRNCAFPNIIMKYPTRGVRNGYVMQYAMTQLYSPEISYFKNLTVNSPDYIKYQGKLGGGERRYTYTAPHPDSPLADDISAQYESIYYITNNYNNKSGWIRFSRYKSTEQLRLTTQRKYEIVEGVIAEPFDKFGEESNAIAFTTYTEPTLNRAYDYRPIDTDIHHEGASGTCAVLALKDTLIIDELEDVDDQHETFLVDYKIAGRAAFQYGGLTYNSRKNNIYIDCTPYIDITEGENTIRSFGGDTYIGFFEFVKTFFDVKDLDEDLVVDIQAMNRIFQAVAFPCESHINLDLDHGATYSKNYLDRLIHAIKEKKGEWLGSTSQDDITRIEHKLIQEEDMYQYNPVYSQNNNSKLYFNKPDLWKSVVKQDTLIKMSLEKYPNEQIDAYLKFLTDNERLLSTEYGEVNDLFLFKNYMIVFFDRAFGILSIDERALLPIQNNTLLELGAGDNLRNFDYISTRSGSIHPQSISYCGEGFVWFDAITGSMGYYNGQTNDLGLTKGMSSVMKRFVANLGYFTDSLGSYYNNPLHGGSIMCYENLHHNEVLLSMTRSCVAALDSKATGTGWGTLSFNLSNSPGNYKNAYVVIDGEEYIASIITPTSMAISSLDNPGLDVGTAKWAHGANYHVYFKDISAVYSFSNIIGAFMHEVDMFPTWMFEYNNNVYTVLSKFQIWKENEGDYGQFYGRYREGLLDFLINPKGSLVCLFNNYEYSTEAYDTYNTNLLDETWDSIRVFNDYQYSASQDYNCIFVASAPEGNNIIRRNPPNPHELVTGDLVSFSGNTIPHSIDIEKYYYVRKVDDTNFQIMESLDDIIVPLTNTSGYLHKIDIPLSTVIEPINAKRRFRIWRIKDLRDYRGYITGQLKPRIRDTHVRLAFKYDHNNHKGHRLIMHDLMTYYSLPAETIANNQRNM